MLKGYDKDMDTECIPICNAINSIIGFKTVESCCGHGKNKFSVYIHCDESRQLFSEVIKDE